MMVVARNVIGAGVREMEPRSRCFWDGGARGDRGKRDEESL
jgi:hypothetical protein